MPAVSRPDKYQPPKPIANNCGKFSVVITLDAHEWSALDAKAKQIDLSRAALARQILRGVLQ